jgi:AcrR family transcriptional regulator
LPDPDPALGLRERKKLKTRALIQKEALRLFLDKGYESTTIDDIAEAAEVSPSTFFNYFPSKEAVVIEDDLDPLIFAAFNAQPPEVSPVAALRMALLDVLSGLAPAEVALMNERIALMSSEPDLRAALLNQFASFVEQFSELVAHRVRRPATDFAVRNLAGALMGVMMSVLVIAADDPNVDLIHLANQALAHLDAGLPLDWPGDADEPSAIVRS